MISQITQKNGIRKRSMLVTPYSSEFMPKPTPTRMMMHTASSTKRAALRRRARVQKKLAIMPMMQTPTRNATTKSSFIRRSYTQIRVAKTAIVRRPGLGSPAVLPRRSDSGLSLESGATGRSAAKAK